MRQHYLPSMLLGLLVAGSVLAGIVIKAQEETANTTISPTPSAPQVTLTPTTTPHASPTPTISPTPQTVSIFFPMTSYAARITNRGYGKVITHNDDDTLACGADFEGYHTGDDLEVPDNELESEVPVYAVANGTVRQRSNVNGYGGLIVIEHTLEGQTVTAYYGHINLAQTTLTPGSSVRAGERISILGKGCSSETDGERKHLHFAIHKGKDVAVKGYINSRDELNDWINPLDTLNRLGAKNPN